jgi:molecular chaperone DnaK
MPQIEVTFDIDANGILHVSAKDQGTGNEQQIRIEGGSGLKPEEVERMMKEAEDHATEAHAMRELADAKNMAENLVYQTEKALKEHRDALDEQTAGTIEGRIMELNEALKGSDLAEVKAKTEALVDASQKLGEAMYAQASAEPAQAADGDGAATDDEVVEDADYEVVEDEK